MSPYPSLLQINTRVWLRQLSQEAGRRITLSDIGDGVFDGWAEAGFDWIWLLSVWQTGAAARAVSRSNADWRAEFKAVLPDLTEDDICGSGFAITAYSVNDALGGEAALAQFRSKLSMRGIRLMLDFIPNHTAPDHPWVRTNPDYYVAGDDGAFAATPANYLRVETDQGTRLLAHGRDPNYPGWPDTLQLNYANPDLQAAQLRELMAISERCDGVRCDMAMLLLPEIFERTWGLHAAPFWPKAIAAVRERKTFTFAAEVYWDLEWTLQQQGFDYCYDKRLYDRLREENAGTVRDHLRADLAYQTKLIRFLENHDEPRAASQFPWPRHPAAAAITFFSPGLRFFQQGQFEGALVRVPVHLCRGPVEPANADIAAFYKLLLSMLKTRPVLRDGGWSLIEPLQAWEGNGSHDNFVACVWSNQDSRLCLVVNFAELRGQCRLRLPFPDLAGRSIRLRDLVGPEIYQRDGSEMVGAGLFVDHAPWQINLFKLD